MITRCQLIEAHVVADSNCLHSLLKSATDCCQTEQQIQQDA